MFKPSPPDISELYGVSADSCLRCRKPIPADHKGGFCPKCDAAWEAQMSAEYEALVDWDKTKESLTQIALRTPPRERSMFQRKLADEFLGVEYD